MRPHPIGNGTLAPRIPFGFAAVMEALQMLGADQGGLVALNDIEWETLLEFCDLAHLTLPLATVAGAEFPAWVLDRLAKNARDNRDRFVQVYAAYSEARLALEQAGIPHVVLKGFTQAPEFVSDPRLRMQSDIDVFCPPEHTRAAESVLMTLGYHSVSDQDYSAADHLPTLARPGLWKWRGNAYDPAMPPSFEIHFCLWNEKVSLIHAPEVELFWRRRVTVNHGDLIWVGLGTPDKLGYLALHILRGVLSGDWVVHHVYELACFLSARARDVVFWEEWLNLHSIYLRRLQAIAFSLAQSWFSCPMPEAGLAVINGLPDAQKHWLERFGGSPLETMFRRNKDGRLLHWLMADSPAARKGILRRALLPNSIPGPAGSAKRMPYRRRPREGKATPLLWSYAKYLCERTWAHLSSDVELLCHGASAWLYTRSLRGQFWLFVVASFFFDLGLSVYFFLFNLVLIAHGYSEQQLGVLTAAMSAGSLMGALPAGLLIRRAGLRRSLMLCQIVAPAVLCVRAFMMEFWAQCGLAILAGGCLCLWAVSLSPTTASLTEEKDRSTAFSLLFSLGIGMGAFGGLLGSRMPGWFHGLESVPGLPAPDQMTLLVAALMAMVGVFFTAALRERPTPVVERALPFLSQELRQFLPAVASWGFVTGAFSPFANVYLAQHAHMPLAHIGNVFSASQLFQVMAVLAAPPLFRRAGISNGIFYAQMAVCVCLLVLANSSGAITAGCVYILLTGAQWMSEPGIYSMLMVFAPQEQRSGASASMALVMGCAQLLAAGCAGWSYTNLGYSRALGLLACVAAFAGMLFKALPTGKDNRETLSSAPVRADG